MDRAERTLVLLLRLSAAVLLTAIVPAKMRKLGIDWARFRDNP